MESYLVSGCAGLAEPKGCPQETRVPDWCCASVHGAYTRQQIIAMVRAHTPRENPLVCPLHRRTGAELDRNSFTVSSIRQIKTCGVSLRIQRHHRTNHGPRRGATEACGMLHNHWTNTRGGSVRQSWANHPYRISLTTLLSNPEIWFPPAEVPGVPPYFTRYSR